MVTNAMEYLTENSLSVYPFRDYISQVPTTGLSNPLPTNVFVDAVILLRSSAYKKAYLYSFEMLNSATFGGAKAFKFNIWITDENGVKLTDVIFEKQASTVVKHDFISFTSSDQLVMVKLVPGEGMVNYYQNNLDFYMRFFDTTAGKPFLEFLPSTVIMPQPRITSTDFYNNWVSGIGTLVGTYTSNLRLKERANIDFISVSPTQVDINVEPGAGSGLYNPCVAGDPVVRNINGIQPNGNGDLLAGSDNCLEIVEGTNSIQIAHTCTPKCTEEHVKALAYYINRIKDGMITLGEYVNTNADSIRSELFLRMEEYKAKLEALQKPKAPFIEVESAKTNSSSKTFVSFAVGIYDPNKTKATVNLSIVPDINTTQNPTTGFKHIADTAILKEDNNEYPLPFHTDTYTTWVMPDRTLDCYSVIAVNAVYSIPKAEVDRTVLFKLTEPTSVTHPSTSTKMQVVNPNGIYYTFKSRRVWTTTGTPRYVYTFIIDLFKQNLTIGGSNAVSTTLNLSLPVELTYVTDSAKLSANNVMSSINGPTGNMISNVSIDYVKKNFITFEADYVPINPSDEQTLTFSLTPTMTISGDSFAKTIVIR